MKQELPERTLLRWGYAWAALMFAMSIANIAVAQYCSLETWGAFISALVAGKLAFFFLQYLTMRTAIRARRSAKAG